MDTTKLIRQAALTSLCVIAFAGTAHAQQLPWQPPPRRTTGISASFRSLSRTTTSQADWGAQPRYRTDVTIRHDGQVVVEGRTPAGNLRRVGQLDANTLQALHLAVRNAHVMPARFWTASPGLQTGSFHLQVQDVSRRVQNVTGGHDWTGHGAQQLTQIMNAIDAAVLSTVPALATNRVDATVAVPPGRTAWLVTPDAHYQVVPLENGSRLFPLLGQQVTAVGQVRAHGAWFPFSADMNVQNISATTQVTGNVAGTILNANAGGLALRTDDGAVVPLTGGGALHPVLAGLVGRHVLLHGLVTQDQHRRPLAIVADALGAKAQRNTLLRRPTQSRDRNGAAISFGDESFNFSFRIGSAAPREERRQVGAGQRLWITQNSPLMVVLPNVQGTWQVDGRDLTVDEPLPPRPIVRNGTRQRGAQAGFSTEIGNLRIGVTIGSGR